MNGKLHQSIVAQFVYFMKNMKLNVTPQNIIEICLRKLYFRVLIIANKYKEINVKQDIWKWQGYPHQQLQALQNRLVTLFGFFCSQEIKEIERLVRYEYLRHLKHNY